MGIGQREPKQGAFWVATQDLPKSPGHPFYEKLNALLREAEFDPWVEDLCAPYYAEGVGRRSIPPGNYFRMLFAGYFEGIDSQRGIAWRFKDSLSLRAFLGLLPGEDSPDHSSLTVIRQRLPVEVHELVFAKGLEVVKVHGLVQGKTVAGDTTTLEANAAMKSIVRKGTGDDWKQYLKQLAAEAGLENPTEEELRRFDRKRPGKKVSNDDWESPTDPDSRIAKMKDGTTHLAYKAEHVVDLDTDVVLAATVHPGDRADGDSLPESLVAAETNLIRAGSETAIQEVVADKGYHKAETLAQIEGWGIRTYIPEPERKAQRRWTDKPAEWRDAVYGNRRRCSGQHGRKLQRRRSEHVERSFAHLCETGGARRTWIRGLPEVAKRYLMQAAAHNLGVMMRKLFGVGTPRALQGLTALLGSFFDLGHGLRIVLALAGRLFSASFTPIRVFGLRIGSTAAWLACRRRAA